jgi:hypothetical protein
MILYHGSYIEIPNPDADYGRANLDFGRGFYVTAVKEQAGRWAKRRLLTYKALHGEEELCATVSTYEFDDSAIGIKTKVFSGYTEEWLDFVVANRSGSTPTGDTGYDIIYGNIANDDVARAIDDYLELSRKGRVNEDVKRALLFQLRFSNENDQYCFASKLAIDRLHYTGFYRLEDK